ncbi:MAG: tetratricopeptide repeat protein [Candidatus Schekmanbacteria bacterium]|nr:tetratricopeptide repeat protein [Candidatus Schekmanbacteria bacterium]
MDEFGDRLEYFYRKHPSTRLFYPLAETYRLSGRLGEAIAILQSGLQHHPDYAAARRSLVVALRSDRRRDEAARELKTLVSWLEEQGLSVEAHEELERLSDNEAVETRAGTRPEALPAADVGARRPRLKTDLEAGEGEENLSDTLRLSRLPLFEELERASAEGRTADDSAAASEDARDALDVLPFAPELDSRTMTDELLADPWADVLTTARSSQEDIAERFPDSDDLFEVDEEDEEIFLEAPGGDAAPDQNDESPLATRTLADLYMSQGHFVQAAEIFRQLVAQRPGDYALESALRAALAAQTTQKLGEKSARTEGVPPMSASEARALPDLERFLKGVLRVKAERGIGRVT